MVTNKEKLREALRFNDLPVVLREAAEKAERVIQRLHDSDKAFERQMRNDAYEDKSKEWKRAETAELSRNIWFFAAIFWCAVACLLFVFHH